MSGVISTEAVAELLAEPDTDDAARIQLAILLELRELNVRLARAEAMTTALMTGKSAKWLALFAKTAPGSRT